MHKTLEVRRTEALERIADSLEQLASPVMVTQLLESVQLGAVDPNVLLKQLQQFEQADLSNRQRLDEMDLRN